jgi:hypothetical protein
VGAPGRRRLGLGFYRHGSHREEDRVRDRVNEIEESESWDQGAVLYHIWDGGKYIHMKKRIVRIRLQVGPSSWKM